LQTFFFFGSFNEANIINIYHYTIWWSPNQTFLLNFESPNGHLLILNFSDSFICESTFISKNIFSLWSSYAKLEWLNKALKGGKKGFNVENIFIGTTFNNNRFARMCEPILIFQTLFGTSFWKLLFIWCLSFLRSSKLSSSNSSINLNKVSKLRMNAIECKHLPTRNESVWVNVCDNQKKAWIRTPKLNFDFKNSNLWRIPNVHKVIWRFEFAHNEIINYFLACRKYFNTSYNVMGLHFQTNIMARNSDLKSISKYVPKCFEMFSNVLCIHSAIGGANHVQIKSLIWLWKMIFRKQGHMSHLVWKS